MNPTWIAIGFTAATLIFAAGGAWLRFRQIGEQIERFVTKEDCERCMAQTAVDLQDGAKQFLEIRLGLQEINETVKSGFAQLTEGQEIHTETLYQVCKSDPGIDCSQIDSLRQAQKERQVKRVIGQ